MCVVGMLFNKEGRVRPCKAQGGNVCIGDREMQGKGKTDLNEELVMLQTWTRLLPFVWCSAEPAIWGSDAGSHVFS